MEKNGNYYMWSKYWSLILKCHLIICNSKILTSNEITFYVYRYKSDWQITLFHNLKVITNEKWKEEI